MSAPSLVEAVPLFRLYIPQEKLSQWGVEYAEVRTSDSFDGRPCYNIQDYIKSVTGMDIQSDYWRLTEGHHWFEFQDEQFAVQFKLTYL